jgi:hypothetical protein
VLILSFFCQGVYSRLSRQAPLNEKVRRSGPLFPRAARRADPCSLGCRQSSVAGEQWFWPILCGIGSGDTTTIELRRAISPE